MARTALLMLAGVTALLGCSLVTTGCAPMSSTVRTAAIRRAHARLALQQDRQRVREDVAAGSPDVRAAVDRYVADLHRFRQVFGADAVRQALTDTAAELRADCPACAAALEQALRRLESSSAP